MNEDLREFVMKAIRGMIDSNRVPEWQVRKYALDWYSKGILTEEDLQEIEDRYKPEPVEDDTVDTVDTVEDTENTNEEAE